MAPILISGQSPPPCVTESHMINYFWKKTLNIIFEPSFNLISHLETTHRVQLLHTLRSKGVQEKAEGPHLKLQAKLSKLLKEELRSNNTSISNYCCFRIHFLFFIHPNLTVASKLKVLARTLSEGGARAQP